MHGGRHGTDDIATQGSGYACARECARGPVVKPPMFINELENKGKAAIKTQKAVAGSRIEAFTDHLLNYKAGRQTVKESPNISLADAPARPSIKEPLNQELKRKGDVVDLSLRQNPQKTPGRSETDASQKA